MKSSTDLTTDHWNNFTKRKAEFQTADFSRHLYKGREKYIIYLCTCYSNRPSLYSSEKCPFCEQKCLKMDLCLDNEHGRMGWIHHMCTSRVCSLVANTFHYGYNDRNSWALDFLGDSTLFQRFCKTTDLDALLKQTRKGADHPSHSQHGKQSQPEERHAPLRTATQPQKPYSNSPKGK